MPKLILLILFLINAFFYLYKAGSWELRGDESAMYISLAPFFQELLRGRLFPSFLAFYHEPLQLAVQVPGVFFGLSEFVVRLPDITSGILLFPLIYRLGKLFTKDMWSIVILTALYTFSGFFLQLRLGIHLGFFALLAGMTLYYLLRFDKSGRKGDFYKCLGFLFLASFTFVDGLFIIPGLFLYLFFRRRPLPAFAVRALIILSGAVLLTLATWFLATLAGSVFSRAYDWRSVAPARLFFRGSHFSLLSFKANWEVFTEFNSLVWSMGFVFLWVRSLVIKEARLVWLVFGPPIIFFNLVATPTTHILNFIVPITILAWFGARKISGLAAAVIVVVMIVFNLQHIFFDFQKINRKGDKIAATFIRQHSDTCEAIATNYDGYKFRLYFGRGYIGNITGDARLAVVDGSLESAANYFVPDNFGLRAIVIGENGQKISLYQKDYSGRSELLKDSDGRLFGFWNLVPYVSSCRSFRF